MREHYRKFGGTRPCIYSDAAMGIDGEMGKGRTIDKIQHIDFLGRVIETVPGKGSAMPFVDSVRLYRVTLK